LYFTGGQKEINLSRNKEEKRTDYYECFADRVANAVEQPGSLSGLVDFSDKAGRFEKEAYIETLTGNNLSSDSFLSRVFLISNQGKGVKK